ncbi:MULTISPECIES: hypothetical protein [unclassified Streptomyces]|uniref:hypothetical protein n=1 Tax=unclassified Streptomyces TaxID=2593676 RepID=UPI0033E86A68
MNYRVGEVVMDAARLLVGKISAIEGSEITLTRPSGTEWVQEERLCRPASPQEKAALTPQGTIDFIGESHAS